MWFTDQVSNWSSQTHSPGHFYKMMKKILMSMPYPLYQCLIRASSAKEATDNDPLLQQLSSIIKAGWPSNKQETPKECLPLCNYRDELSVYDHAVFKGERIVIPKKMQSEIKCCNTSAVHIQALRNVNTGLEMSYSGQE